jgi:hypothetical protein
VGVDGWTGGYLGQSPMGTGVLWAVPLWGTECGMALYARAAREALACPPSPAMYGRVCYVLAARECVA